MKAALQHAASRLPHRRTTSPRGREGRDAAPVVDRQEPLPAAPLDERTTIAVFRAKDDHGVPYQVALAAQDLLDAILGDEPFDLADAASMLARLAEFTEDGHGRDRLVWTRGRVLARVAELVALYNPPPELGGDIPTSAGRGVAGELAVTR